jgi:hypothetical protein
MIHLSTTVLVPIGHHEMILGTYYNKELEIAKRKEEW